MTDGLHASLVLCLNRATFLLNFFVLICDSCVAALITRCVRFTCDKERRGAICTIGSDATTRPHHHLSIVCSCSGFSSEKTSTIALNIVDETLILCVAECERSILLGFYAITRITHLTTAASVGCLITLVDSVHFTALTGHRCSRVLRSDGSLRRLSTVSVSSYPSLLVLQVVRLFTSDNRPGLTRLHEDVFSACLSKCSWCQVERSSYIRLSRRAHESLVSHH